MDDLSIEITQGVTVVLGPNGAGKSTLLEMCATVAAPDRGHIEIFGRSAAVDADNDDLVKIRRRIGYLPQEVEYPRGITVNGFLDYIAVLKEHADIGVRRQMVREVLAAVELDRRPTARVRTLSGGERRRLAFAQALIGDPPLLVLDEPMTGLDPRQRAVVRGLIIRRAQQGAVLIATHHTDGVDVLADRVVVLDEGRIVFDGTVPDLLATVPTAPGASASVEDAYLRLTGVNRGTGFG